LSRSALSSATTDDRASSFAEPGDALERLGAVEQDHLAEGRIHLGDELVLGVPRRGGHAHQAGDADAAGGGHVEDSGVRAQEDGRLLERLDEDLLYLLLGERAACGGGCSGSGHDDSRD